MEENKKKINLTTYVISLIILLGVIIGLVIYIIQTQENKNCNLNCNEHNCTNTTPRNNNYNWKIDPEMVCDKPIIYLYPEKEMEVTVKLCKEENLSYTYPKYKNKWKVVAKPNGDLVDVETGRKLYALYWEGKNTKEYNNINMKEGFCVKGEDTIKFLEEKLAQLGLNEREAEEFIVYWLPKMESNKYNYIRFQTKEEIEENMPLEIEQKPDTVIRVMMEFKPLDGEVEVKEQKIETPKREGFVVVEWGGTEIK